MLRVGIIGYGARIAHMAKQLKIFGIPYQVTAVADPRADEIKAKDDGFLSAARFYPTADALLAEASQLDGVMVGTRCGLHTEIACKVAPYVLPLFLEKPVAKELTAAQGRLAVDPTARLAFGVLLGPDGCASRAGGVPSGPCTNRKLEEVAIGLSFE